MRRETQADVEARLRGLLLEARSLADTKRLADVFEMELFSLERSVAEAIATRSEDTVRLATAQGRRLLAALEEAPDKSGGLLMR